MRSKIVVHNGHNFRSITEARWAVFFECLGIPYEYEKDVFKLEEDIYYLPDFWLPEQNIWIEIKGALPKAEELHKAVKLYEMTGNVVYILTGFPDVMPFLDPLKSDGYVNEICNFGTYIVDKENPDKCVKFQTKAANITMMHILELNSPNMQEYEFQLLSDRFNHAVILGKKELFFRTYLPN